MDAANTKENAMENEGSFTVSERFGSWGASYFRDEHSRPSDQGICEPTCEAAVARVREMSSIYNMPYGIIRTRTESGVWGVAE